MLASLMLAPAVLRNTPHSDKVRTEGEPAAQVPYAAHTLTLSEQREGTTQPALLCEQTAGRYL